MMGKGLVIDWIRNIMRYDVFISSKSEDYHLAEEVYDFLTKNGLSVFIASAELQKIGEAQYAYAIDEALDESVHMIVVASSLSHIKSKWVRYEWSTFSNDIKSGYRTGNLLTILSGSIEMQSLPASLRHQQSFHFDTYKKGILDYLKTHIKENNISEDKEFKQSPNGHFYQCPNGHYYQGTKCPFCKDTSSQSFKQDPSMSNRIVMGDNEGHTCITGYKNVFNRNDYPVPREVVGRLVTCDSDNTNEVFNIYKGRNIIGRDANCNITIADGMVSLEHAVLNFRNGEFFVTDRYSSYGTFVNGVDIDLDPCVLKNGDIITIGKTQLRFVNDMSEENQQLNYASVFAPAEVKRKSHMLVQVYIHLYEDTERVKSMALESQKNVERRDYIPLQCKLKNGDKVDILFSIYGETLLMSEKKSLIWQGSFMKCGFDYFVPNDIDVEDLSCLALLALNDIPIGEMRFVTKIVEEPKQQTAEIISNKYHKVFISYAHSDESKVRSFHEGLKLSGVEHFFDRDYLKAGDIFPQVIQDYINTADLFVLFWSKNASKSDYVDKERKQALERAFPKVKPQQAAKLSIYPMSIEPRAELPKDMKDYYHFGEI